MKKIFFASIATLLLILSFSSFNASAATPPVADEKTATIAEKEKVESPEAKAVLARLEEIKAMDKSEMTAKEKRELRKEVRALKTKAAQLGGGVYISAGALIVILLLILLL